MQLRYLELFNDNFSPPPRAFTVAELQSLLKWCQVSGVMPEGTGGAQFDLTGRPWLEPLYSETRDKLHHRRVYMKAAQLGLTTRMLYRCMWFTADSDKRINVALMFPTATDVQDLNKTRFRPSLRSSARMLELIQDVDAVEVVRVGVSNMRFRGMRSAVGMDSFPADVLEFDEVRLMDRAAIERVFMRVSDSSYVDEQGRQGIIELNSTAGFPGEDIDYYFQRSTMHTWHAFCPSHGAIDVARVFPDCVDTDKMRFICPQCGKEIYPERGKFVRLGDAKAEWDGYAFSQLCKGKKALPDIMNSYNRMVVEGVNPGEFFNSRLGLAHQDPNAVLVTPEIFNIAIGLDKDYTAPIQGENWNPQGYPVSMGIDQRGVEKHVSIWRWGAMGRVYLVYLETVEASGRESVGRCAHLFDVWNCDIAVVDAYPSYDFARDLARQLPKGKTYLAEYHSGQTQPIEWHDYKERKNKRTKRSSGEAKYEYLVSFNRYMHLLQWLTMWRNQRVVLPVDAETMVQERTLNGIRAPVQQVFDMRIHFKNIARVNATRLERNPETGENMDTGGRVYKFRNLALDPHWIHSSGYALAGLMRKQGTSQIWYSNATENNNQRPEQISLKQRLKQQKKTCAGCHFFKLDKEPMGVCHNQREQMRHGSPRPLKTSAKAVACNFWRKLKAK